MKNSNGRLEKNSSGNHSVDPVLVGLRFHNQVMEQRRKSFYAKWNRDWSFVATEMSSLPTGKLAELIAWRAFNAGMDYANSN